MSCLKCFFCKKTWQKTHNCYVQKSKMKAFTGILLIYLQEKKKQK